MALGKVYLVGAGPGDPGLLTLRGRACLERADLVMADYLVNPVVLKHVPKTAEIIVRPERRAGPYGSQQEICTLLVERARAGQVVVRLKGGDPFVFGRGGEEAEVLVRAGVPFEVVPGVTAAVAVPAYAGIPITHRGLSGVVAFATGHEAESTIDWEGVARAASTLVLYMSVKQLGKVVARLRAAGRRDDEPVAVVERGTLPRQRTITGTLATIVEKAALAGIEPPALTVVGPVVSLRQTLQWFETQPLLGRRVLVLSTRPPAGVDERGAEIAWASPLCVIPRFAEVKTRLADLPRMRALALTSPHAATVLLQALMASGQDARALGGLRLCAVGEATSGRLAEAHLRADLVAQGGGEALAREIADAQVAGPVMVLRAAAGRDELPACLRALGYEVEVVDAYDTVPDEVALASVAEDHHERPFDAVAFTSPKGASAFLQRIGGPAALGGALVGAIGDTTGAALAEAGVNVQVTPERPDQAALVCALLDRLQKIE